MNASDAIQVATTVADKEDAQRIANRLVGERLAACVQVIGPITSTYWWQGEVETCGEWLCLAKTNRQLYAKVEALILRDHPYDVPEILATPCVEGSQAYLEWLDRELKSDDGTV